MPMKTTDGHEALCSLQFIAQEGFKRFLRGGRTRGAYFPIGDPSNATALCVAEGFATGATIHEATGHPVAVAFNAGNLESVARAMRAKFPNLPIIICADDDHATSGLGGVDEREVPGRHQRNRVEAFYYHRADYAEQYLAFERGLDRLC